MDVKSAFLNGIIEEEVYIEQPTSYVKKGQKNKVYRLKKGLDVTKDPRPNSLSFWVRVGFLTYILDSLVDTLEVFSLSRNKHILKL